MKKRVMSVMLTLAMAASIFSGCSGKSSSGSNSTSGTESKSSNSKAPYTVVMGYIGDKFNDQKEVEDKINAILEPALNAKIELRQYSWGTYQQELQLTLSGDENLDIVPIVVTNAAGYVNNGQVKDLSGYIDKYGTNIKKDVDASFLNCPKIGKVTYGVTTKREQITDEGIMMRKDILQKMGYHVGDDGICTDIKSLDDLTAAYAKVKAANPTMIMCGSAANSTPLFRWETSDFLTDGFGVLMDYGQSTKVVNLYDTDEFKNFAKLMYQWNQSGYFSSDAATTTEALVPQMKAGNTFSYFTPYKAGAIEQDELSSGQQLAFAPLFGDPYITSYSVNFFTWGIARNSKDPVTAFKVLDYIYGSSDVMNLLNWGIEGKHYKVVDAQNKVIDYADGVNATNTGWCLNIGWELPNQENSYVWKGETSAKWQKQKELIDSAKHSKALGFSYDSSSVSNQLTALNNVKAQYYDAIGCGSVNPDTAIPQFNQALNNAGLKEVISAKQSQLDDWLKTQK